MKRDKQYEAITVCALRLRHDLYFGGGMDRDAFDDNYLDGIGDYERDLAKKEDIIIDT